MIQKTLEFIEINIINEFGEISDDELNNDKYDIVALKWLVATYPQV